eukprot:CAMPEP_0184660666 /NCGR_PEP_ID=MMETSP0308-20130426/34684_1 /TAXON_ID=38269 /ORGANISM="Gloeochaete witrockiana, Strain SAG 46.84" /LENGTH=140 /DNA_ID=CAMNT_0027101393 /DNA_START=27 /DNA_END=445 /DNA_ORIENTATION=-
MSMNSVTEKCNESPCFTSDWLQIPSPAPAQPNLDDMRNLQHTSFLDLSHAPTVTAALSQQAGMHPGAITSTSHPIQPLSRSFSFSSSSTAGSFPPTTPTQAAPAQVMPYSNIRQSHVENSLPPNPVVTNPSIITLDLNTL